VEYCNGNAADTDMGKLRAANGHPEPFGVRFFAVGNEMYGNWQLGHMPLADYVKKHNEVVDALRKADPTAQLVAVGSLGDWDKAMLSQAADHMTYLSEHIYVKEKTAVLAHTAQLADAIKKVADAHREYRRTIPGLAARNVRLAMDEWNYWYGDYLYGELGCRYHWKDGLGVARGLHEFFRNSDLFFMANYAQTVNVLGCIKTTRTDACFDATGAVLALYRQHFGSIPIEAPRAVGNLDVAAAWADEKRAEVTIAIVNPTMLAEEVKLDVGPAGLGEGASRWMIAAADPEDYNEPGKPPRLAAAAQAEQLKLRDQTLAAPAYSVAIYRVPAKKL
jgi:alpha-N-arabinofuranosidase